MANPDKDSFLNNYSMGVSSEFESGKDRLKAFFITKGFNNEQAEALTYSLRKA